MLSIEKLDYIPTRLTNPYQEHLAKPFWEVPTAETILCNTHVLWALYVLFSHVKPMDAKM